MKTIHAILLLPFLAAFVASCGDNKAAENKIRTEVIPVKLLPLNGQSAGTAAIAVSGQFTTDDETMLSFKTGGIIQSLLVKEGDAIKAGQLLATLNLTEINAQVTQAQLGFEKAQRDYNRVLHLYQDSVATLEQLQNAKTGMSIAEEQYKSAEFNRSHSQIRATSNGYVLRKLASEGQLVQGGTPVFETNGAQSGNWLLRVDLSNKQWAAIQQQDKATVEIESVAGKMFEGVVVRKTEGLNQASGTFRADIRLTGAKPAAIAYGMFGKAVIQPAGGAGTGVAANGTNTKSSITGAGNNGPWAVPYDALMEGDGSTGYVFITNDHKTAKKVTVTIGGMEKDQVIITNGLEQAAALIISGSAYLTDGSPISVK
ncbi:efflux RND transporter periplasmic adaptor subunit [Chitinophaga sancti]|nr:efflux RND transporter periplasmic adaptor subunit [Chitinophaga sancti]WQD63302.1 efflux RND transporter periplasmic adaptor subunit [Chitinophaga sancti]WQG91072.1 efflux RND transporter periplasmic adaptor subunit [Chitinophaga sancti]